MMGRTIIVLVGALLLGAVVVRSAFVDAYATRNPEKVAVVWPSHPSVILASGLAEVGASAAAAQPVNPATVRRMLGASTKVPLAAEPFLVRGVQAQVAGDSSLAQRAFLAARQRDPRSVAARYFLADHHLKLGQTQQGLAEISALTRLVPSILGEIAPQLAAFARMPGGREQVGKLLRDQPQLEPWLLNELAGNPTDANLTLSLWSGRSTDRDRAWQKRLIDSLVSAGRVEQARAAWSRFNPRIVRTSELIDPKFEQQAMPPFGWELASGAAGIAEPQGGGQLHILYYGRDDLVLARQLLLLKPGAYRLALRVNGAQFSAKALSWIVRCTSSSREIANISFDIIKPGALAVDFDVPPHGCSVQSLELQGKAPELPEQVDLTISDLSIARRTA